MVGQTVLPPTKNTTDLTGMDKHCPGVKGQQRKADNGCVHFDSHR